MNVFDSLWPTKNGRLYRIYYIGYIDYFKKVKCLSNSQYIMKKKNMHETIEIRRDFKSITTRPISFFITWIVLCENLSIRIFSTKFHVVGCTLTNVSINVSIDFFYFYIDSHIRIEEDHDLLILLKKKSCCRSHRKFLLRCTWTVHKKTNPFFSNLFFIHFYFANPISPRNFMKLCYNVFENHFWKSLKKEWISRSKFEYIFNWAEICEYVSKWARIGWKMIAWTYIFDC